MHKLNGQELCELILKKKMDPQALNKHQRRVAMWYLWTETQSNKSQIGALLQLPHWTVTREIARIEKEAVQEYLPEPGEVKKIISRLISRANILYSRAMAKGYLNLCWKIENDLADKLGRFGYAQYDGTLLRAHFGDVIQSGGQKTSVSVEKNVSILKDMTDDERKLITRVLAQVQSRTNRDKSLHMGNGTSHHSGESVQL